MKRTLSILLALIFVLSAVSFTAFAVDDDLAPSDEDYEIWLGNTKVTDENKDDILDDGGKAKYDPSTHTLTLNNPTIVPKPGSAMILVSYEIKNITLKGSYHMTKSYDYVFDGIFVTAI